ncbi:hypothetical protein B0H65DRAFT_457799 [Neurospora tetraspora]|uniref:2EXR domain-containing protein n=1 Tax=Neurospora tetraspora TaxID=94610 RepID=A0AAE0MUX1_9PEZI|nr:hypothetical protein B0H65DRAFT_457799 [Neurospora tetraspora]
MTTFHRFPRLPAELRLRVWELTVEPRTVDFRINTPRASYTAVEGFNGSPVKAQELLSTTPPPATLQACQESRNHLQGRVYGQVFCAVCFCDIVSTATFLTFASASTQDPNPNHNEAPTTNQAPPPAPAPKPEPEPSQTHHRYIYISFPTDTIDIGTTSFSDFSLFSAISHYLQQQHPSHPSLPSLPSSSRSPTPLAQKITRLKFTRNFSDEYLDRWEIKQGLTRFPNLQQVYCVCGDGIMAWYGATKWIGFENLPCGTEGVWLIDKKDNKEIKAVKWDEAWRVCHNFGSWGGGSLMMNGNATVDDDEW